MTYSFINKTPILRWIVCVIMNDEGSSVNVEYKIRVSLRESVEESEGGFVGRIKQGHMRDAILFLSSSDRFFEKGLKGGEVHQVCNSL